MDGLFRKQGFLPGWGGGGPPGRGKTNWAISWNFLRFFVVFEKSRRGETWKKGEKTSGAAWGGPPASSNLRGYFS